eukprot:TRINITY_DN6632_c0_g2_i1.p1 TRINITY_DN6632_c0_g2~~TRINITY_DN6632_c0_g2_i1.p1  ORF type:complete len:127 (+),score=3.56 TRINITY_DN6632_c0_g2_i1:299-679(+)
MGIVWKLPEYACACGFELQRDNGNGGPFSTVYDTTVSLDQPLVRSFNASGLQSGTLYVWRLKARNLHANGTAWILGNQSTLVDVDPPSAPQNVRIVSTGLDRIHMAWDGPFVAGGGPVLGYGEHLG